MSFEGGVYQSYFDMCHGRIMLYIIDELSGRWRATSELASSGHRIATMLSP